MLKISWGEEQDPYKNVYFIGNPESIMSLWEILKDMKTIRNLEVCSLEGTRVNMNKGIHEVNGWTQRTHSRL
jgi:hypothetical protein